MIHRILFMGTPLYATRYLEELIATDFKPIAVITQPDRPAGRKQIIEPTPVKLVALKHNLPVHQPEDIRDPQWTKKIHELTPELIIVVAFGQIIPQSILNIPPKGCINVHPSLLPRHRGATPWQETILQGDARTGVTIMLMDEKMDHGPILAQEELDMDPNETTASLEDKTAQIGIPLLMQTLKKWFEGTITPVAQNHSQATYTRLLKKESGKIDWSKNAVEIDCMIRALNPWPGTWTEWHGKRVKILKAHLNEQNALIIDELQPEGKKVMGREAFINGYARAKSNDSTNSGFLTALGMT